MGFEIVFLQRELENEKKKREKRKRDYYIQNDGFDYVLDSEFHTVVDRTNPRVEVFIECGANDTGIPLEDCL